MQVRITSTSARAARHQRRLVSTRHAFPFPSCRNPTPHQIFHLPPSASQDDIKSRYYELVKVYHPDSTHGRHDVSLSVRNARFRAITHAYGALRGRNAPNFRSSYESRDEAIRAELRRRARRTTSPPSATTTAEAEADNPQLRYILMAFMLSGIFVAVNAVSTHLDRVEKHALSAAANLAQARADAQVDGMERRRRIRERVRAFNEAKESIDDEEDPEMQNASET